MESRSIPSGLDSEPVTELTPKFIALPAEEASNSVNSDC